VAGAESCSEKKYALQQPFNEKDSIAVLLIDDLLYICVSASLLLPTTTFYP